MDAQTLSMLFGTNAGAIRLNLDGVTHELSLVRPEAAGNCINWVVGHIIASRNQVLELVGAAPIWAEEESAPYGRGSPPLPVGDERELSELREVLDASQEVLIERLGEISDEELGEVVGKKSRLEQLVFLHFHEAYHVGQLGLLRRLVGLGGAIT